MSKFKRVVRSNETRFKGKDQRVNRLVVRRIKKTRNRKAWTTFQHQSGWGKSKRTHWIHNNKLYTVYHLRHR